MRICINCLGVDGPVIDYPIGHDIGPQMDPTRKTISLCPNCRSYLESGDMKNFHLRYSETRMVSRG